MENRKNTILLTVIAVATLLVAVVGATFAYFTAQGAGPGETPVKVTTYTSSTGGFEVNGDLAISANQNNFAENGYSHKVTGDATVTFKSSTNEAGTTSEDFCYTVALNITNNTFATEAGENTGVLLINASEDTLGAFATGDSLTNGTGTNATFVTGTSGYNATATPDAPTEGTAGQTTTFDGFDVMPLTAGTYYFQKSTGMETAGSTKVYKLTSANGAKVTHSWDFSVTLVNTAANQNALTGKTFDSKLVFTQVDCETGSAM